jgi:hypothetical protein
VGRQVQPERREAVALQERGRAGLPLLRPPRRVVRAPAPAQGRQEADEQELQGRLRACSRGRRGGGQARGRRFRGEAASARSAPRRRVLLLRRVPTGRPEAGAGRRTWAGRRHEPDMRKAVCSALLFPPLPGSFPIFGAPLLRELLLY